MITLLQKKFVSSSITFGVVVALALAVHHARYVLVLLLLGNAPGGVAVAGAGAPHHHVVDGVVILLPDVDGVRLLQVLVAQRVELGEGHPEVGRLQQVLHLLAVRVEPGRVELDVGRQHPVDMV